MVRGVDDGFNIHVTIVVNGVALLGERSKRGQDGRISLEVERLHRLL